MNARLSFEPVGSMSKRDQQHDLPRVSVGDRRRLNPPFEMLGTQGRGNCSCQLTPLTLAEGLFPALCPAISVPAVSELALLSTLVGMVVPGAVLDIVGAFVSDPRWRASARMCVSCVANRPALPKCRVGHGRGSHIAATIFAFARYPPTQPPSSDKAAALVVPGEFRGRRALVIGGSRGIGAATAKLIAAGGGTVALSYAHGQREAEAVANDIDGRCGETKCIVFRYDASQDAADQLPVYASPFTHVYYFATPHIFGRSARDLREEQAVGIYGCLR